MIKKLSDEEINKMSKEDILEEFESIHDEVMKRKKDAKRDS